MTSSSEIDLLLGCLRLEANLQRAARLAVYTADDWQTVSRQARLHEVLPLVDWHLHQLDPAPIIPQPVQQKMRQAVMQNAARNMFLYNELSQAVQILQQEAVPVIVLKGMHLAALVYPDMALRQIGDIDLLLQTGDLERASQALIQHGYRPYRQVQVERELSIRRHLPPLFSPQGAVFELHGMLSRPNSPVHIDLQGLWSRSQPAILGGASVQVLAQEDLLLYQGLHLYLHDFRLPLRHLFDLAVILAGSQEQMQWRVFVQRAEEWGAQKCAFLSLRLAARLLNAPLPEAVLEALHPTDFNLQIEELAQARLLASSSVWLMHPDLAALWSDQPLHIRLAAFWRLLFPPPEYIADRYALPRGSKRVYFYYIVRLIELIFRYGRSAWYLLLGKQDARSAARHENTLRDWWMGSNINKP